MKAARPPKPPITDTKIAIKAKTIIIISTVIFIKFWAFFLFSVRLNHLYLEESPEFKLKQIGVDVDDGFVLLKVDGAGNCQILFPDLSKLLLREKNFNREVKNFNCGFTA